MTKKDGEMCVPFTRVTSLRRRRLELSLAPASPAEFQPSAITVILEIAEC